MTRAVTANIFKTQLGAILKDVQAHARFVVMKRNTPVGIFLNLQDYVRDHADEYEDVQDFLDTMMEHADTSFRASLQQGNAQYEKGHYLTQAQLKAALAGKKF